MARKAKHDQRDDSPGWVCEQCRDSNCSQCIDVMRLLYGATKTLCKCKRNNHGGEPVNQQIKDPETGTVYAPGLRVTEEGEVIFNEQSGSDDHG